MSFTGTIVILQATWLEIYIEGELKCRLQPTGRYINWMLQIASKLALAWLVSRNPKGMDSLWLK